MFFVLLSLMLSNPQVDIVDFNGSFLARVRDLAGANPIILVVTKVMIFTLSKNHMSFFYLLLTYSSIKTRILLKSFLNYFL